MDENGDKPWDFGVPNIFRQTKIDQNTSRSNIQISPRGKSHKRSSVWRPGRIWGLNPEYGPSEYDSVMVPSSLLVVLLSYGPFDK